MCEECKNEHSRVYHSARKAMLAKGKSDGEAKERICSSERCAVVTHCMPWCVKAIFYRWVSVAVQSDVLSLQRCAMVWPASFVQEIAQRKAKQAVSDMLKK